MDPRNPLGRLDRLSRDPRIARLAVRFDATGSGEVARCIEVELKDGRRRSFRLGPATSWVDLLDRLAGFLGRLALGGRRRP